MVLVGVHVLIATHILLWWITGTTLSPVEPSETMQTLRDGLVNAGCVMFTLAIASTLVVGRFFCGWACHIVALQDLCSHVMTRMGVRPKPFRSRVLVWGPITLAFYMFVWPVLHRAVLAPIFADSLGRLPAWIGQSRPWPGATARFFVQDFWATFPAWYVAVPLLAVCGFACVYFLGSKGFCTYGCPYGGVFGPIERFAPGRIRVDDNCHQCGHCTAACTSNVRVHEEVRDYGMVVDPGCMKCLDCVSVCPNGALSLGFGAPAIGVKTRDGRAESAVEASALRAARYDPTIVEDLVLGVLMVVLVLAFRGMLNQVPLLMAAGLAGVAAFGAWTCWRLWRVPSVRVQNLQLKFKGRVRGAGRGFVAGTVVVLVLAAWSGSVRLLRLRAELAYAGLETPADVLLNPVYRASASERETAQIVVGWYTRGGPPGEGGYGWALTPDELSNLAYAQLVLGRYDKAEAALRQVIERGRPQDELVSELARIMHQRGAASAEIDAMLAKALQRHPELNGVRTVVSKGLLSHGDRAGAAALWEQAVAADPRNVETVIEAARFKAFELKQPEIARQMLETLGSARAKRAGAAIAGAQLWLQLGNKEQARDWSRRAAELSGSKAPTGENVASAWLLEGAGLRDEALAHERRVIARALAHSPYIGRAEALLQGGLFERSRGDPGTGLALVQSAVDAASISRWDALSAATVILNQARATGDAELMKLGERAVARGSGGAGDTRP